MSSTSQSVLEPNTSMTTLNSDASMTHNIQPNAAYFHITANADNTAGTAICKFRTMPLCTFEQLRGREYCYVFRLKDNSVCFSQTFKPLARVRTGLKRPAKKVDKPPRHVTTFSNNSIFELGAYNSDGGFIEFNGKYIEFEMIFDKSLIGEWIEVSIYSTYAGICEPFHKASLTTYGNSNKVGTKRGRQNISEEDMLLRNMREMEMKGVNVHNVYDMFCQS